MSYFTEPHTNKNEIEVELNLSKYATTSKLQNATGVNTSQFAKKDDLAVLKSEIDKLEIDKVKTVTVYLSKLSNVVKMLLNSMCIIQIKKNRRCWKKKKQMLGN